MNDAAKLSNKTVLIAGAAGKIGAALAKRLAKLGATVIAIDGDEAALVEVARDRPDLIEPLCMDLGNPHNCRLLGEMWQDEPIHYLYNLQHCSKSSEGDFRRLEGMQALTKALLPALARAKGAIVTLCPKREGVQGETIVGAVSNMSIEAARLYEPLDVRANALLLNGDIDVVARGLVTALLFFGHSNAVTGAVVEIGAERPHKKPSEPA